MRCVDVGYVKVSYIVEFAKIQCAEVGLYQKLD